MSKPAVPAAVTYVTDPLIPADIEQRREALQGMAKRGSANSGSLGMVCTMLLAVIIGMGLGSLTNPVFGVAGWAISAVALPFALGWWEASLEETARLDLRRIDARWLIAAPAEASRPVQQIADDVRALPPQLRADFAPLVATVRECCTALATSPNDARYLRMIRDRAAVVGQVRAEYQAVEAGHRAKDAADRFAGDPTGQDLAVATQIRDALSAIRAGLLAAGPGTDPAVDATTGT